MGNSIFKPSAADLQLTLRDVFANAHDIEHPDTWIECGSDNGRLVTLSVLGSGKGIQTVYSDSEMTEELHAQEFTGLTETTALELWQKLMRGETGLP